MPVELPNPADFLPHRGAMLLLGRVTALDAERVEAEATIRADNPLLGAAGFPAWGGLELLAEACGMLLAGGGADRPKAAAIVAVRQMSCAPQRFPVGTTLRIHGELLGGSAAAALCSGRVEVAGESVFSATLTIAKLEE